MWRSIRMEIVGLVAALSPAVLGLVAVGHAAEYPVAAADVVAGTWQQHEFAISYYGITSLYTCDGLEQHVRSILLHFGARHDAKVRATGCPGPDLPSHSAWIKADFFTLQPADPASAPQVVRAYWAPRELTPQRPYFMGGGDCELVAQLHDLISKSFAMRDLAYRTDCVPHEITLDGFSVKADTLVPAPVARR